jgi:acetoin utilization deacetylase AcuC-like enzyme
MHAISDERLLCERCAIVDIDVHHGNGTEEIVRNCNNPGKLFFFSIEGGYGKTPTTANPEANQPLDKSMFSECAMRHVHAMIDPYDAEARFGSSSKE